MPNKDSTLKDVSVIRVAVDDILEGLEQNGPEGPSYQTSVLKITPPFGGEHEATLDRTMEAPGLSLPDNSGEPAYIRPVYFVGYEINDGPPDNTDIDPPTKSSAAKIARQKDFATSIEDPAEHQYNILLNMWHGRIKNELLDEVRIAYDPETGEEARSKVDYY